MKKKMLSAGSQNLIPEILRDFTEYEVFPVYLFKVYLLFTMIQICSYEPTLSPSFLPVFSSHIFAKLSQYYSPSVTVLRLSFCYANVLSHGTYSQRQKPQDRCTGIFTCFSGNVLLGNRDTYCILQFNFMSQYANLCYMVHL